VGCDVFAKKTVRIPTEIIEVCRQRLWRYDDALGMDLRR
jgi:hypothetical protein